MHFGKNYFDAQHVLHMSNGSKIDYVEQCVPGAPNREGGWGVSTPPPPEFWMGGLNTCQPSLILSKNF